jgi:hypothetical protein
MTEQLPEQTRSTMFVEPPDLADEEIARKNMQWGWALLGLFLVLFGGTFAVGFVYLWLD